MLISHLTQTDIETGLEIIAKTNGYKCFGDLPQKLQAEAQRMAAGMIFTTVVIVEIALKQARKQK